MPGHATSVYTKETIRVEAPKGDTKAGYISIHFGKDVIWIDRKQAQLLLNKLSATLAVMQ